MMPDPESGFGETPPTVPAGEASFSYVSGANSEFDQPLVGPIRLRPIQHIEFPLWDAEDNLGDDFDSLNESLGLSRDAYEQIALWQHSFEHLVASGSAATDADWDLHFQQGAALRGMLAAELSPRFEVQLADNYR
jgi:hypothetical protein